MNVEKITMDPDVARRQLGAYRRQLHKRADAEYEAVVSGLEALEKGQAIIMLAQAIATGGFDAKGRPRIAIARADQRLVTFRWTSRWGSNPPVVARFTAPDHDRARAGSYNHRTLEIGVDLAPHIGGQLPAGAQDGGAGGGRALVPMIPATVRELVGRFRADRRFILWEVEKWDPTPPVDPFLLRHLAGDAYAVEAAWDLTPLERAVMTGRNVQ